MGNFLKIILVSPSYQEHCTVNYQKDADELANSVYLDQIDLGLQCLSKIIFGMYIVKEFAITISLYWGEIATEL